MAIRKVLLGTTALVGAGTLIASDAAFAQNVVGGGSYEIELSGYNRFTAGFGELGNRYDSDNTADHNFRVDNEFHVDFTATDDETGIRYGGRVEFKTNANNEVDDNDGIDESWVFIEGGFGQFRFGDEDGAADNMKVFAGSVTAGTGGVDGAGEVASGTSLFFTNSGDDTKAIYYTPDIAGFQAGVSYTPNSNAKGSREPNDQSTNVDGQFQRWVEAGLVYSNSFGAFDLTGSVVGGYATGQTDDTDNLKNWGAGLQMGFGGFQVAGGAFRNAEGGNEDDFWAFNAGLGYSLGPVNTSISYALQRNDSNEEDNQKNLVLSADTGLLPGVALQGDVGYFWDYNNQNRGGNDGFTGVARLNFTY